MPEWFRKNIKPEILGLVDHAPVSGWHSDAVNLSAEVMQRGYAETVKKYEREGRKANVLVDREWRTYKSMDWKDRAEIHVCNRICTVRL